ESGNDGGVSLGPVLIVIAIVIVIPVSVMFSGAALSAVLGLFLKDDAEARYEGSELIELNR
ncbi:MAG TPA: hypothetical protein VGO92_12395, partial [Acidimicrobiales bacterium]|nr:hypothetical protein [Acidimicrobiales bacterium]